MPLIIENIKVVKRNSDGTWLLLNQVTGKSSDIADAIVQDVPKWKAEASAISDSSTPSDSADSSTPSKNELQYEVLNKVVAQGATPEFNSLTKNIGLIDSDGIAKVVNIDTGKLLSKLPAVSVAGGLPASSTDNSGGNNTEKYKVKLAANAGGGTIIFNVMPTIAESHSAQYESFGPAHHPGEILKYKTTPSRSWSINAKLISRNANEASENLRMINTLRSWTMPFYGLGTEKSNNSLLGAPPAIITFSAYGPNAIGPVPTVLETYNWTWPNDVDYIEADFNGNGVFTPFPVIIDLSIALKESWSPSEFSNFDIASYRNGDMNGAFRNAPKSAGKPGTDASTKLGDAAKAEQKSNEISESKMALPTLFQKGDQIKNKLGNVNSEIAKMVAASAKPITDLSSGNL